MSRLSLRPRLVTHPDDFSSLIEALRAEAVVAVDTESNSLYAYRERVCLIQFSTRAADFVVDPLALADLSPLGEVLAEARIEKVFHAAEYDLICLRRDFGFVVDNLFDTMLAARTLGWPSLGLAALLEAHWNVKMNKRLQRANWGARPLRPDLLEYAALDTHYLIPLRDRLLADLRADGRWEEAREEFQRMCAAIGETASAPASNGPDPNGLWRISGARDLSRRQLAALWELYLYREQVAERLDRPPFKIMSDATLAEIARRQPRSAAALAGIPGMTPGQIRRHQQGILKAMARARHTAAPRPPEPERRDEAALARFDALRLWRKQRAQARGVESDVIISRDVLWEIARRFPRRLEELADVPGLGPWRLEQYGREILAALEEGAGNTRRKTHHDRGA